MENLDTEFGIFKRRNRFLTIRKVTNVLALLIVKNMLTVFAKPDVKFQQLNTDDGIL